MDKRTSSLVCCGLSSGVEISFSGATKSNKPNHDGTFLWGCYGSAHSWTRLSFQASCFEIYEFEILLLHFFFHMLKLLLYHFNHMFPFLLLDLVSYWILGCSLWRKNWIYLTQLSSLCSLLLQRHFMLLQIFMQSKNTRTVHRTAVARGLRSH